MKIKGRKKTKVISVRVLEDDFEQARRRISNMKKELELVKDKRTLLKSNADDWKMRAVYEPE